MSIQPHGTHSIQKNEYNPIVHPAEPQVVTGVAREGFDDLTIDLLRLQSASFHFRHSFPTHNNRICMVVRSEKIAEEVVEHAKKTRPILHRKTMNLIESFLEHKKNSGTTIEKKLYAQMTPTAFIDRLLRNRPLVFMCDWDEYHLRDGTGGIGGFEKIGTSEEKEPLTLANYLSYDEIQISALIGVSVPTHFINDGSRHNCSVPQDPNDFESKGIYVGLVGARFEKEGFMEWQHMIVTKEQNTGKNGYGKKSDRSSLLNQWAKFYGLEYFPTFEEVMQDHSGQYIAYCEDEYLNKEVYKKRLRMVIEPFLLDANQRGIEAGKKVYVHTVGLGLGVWKIPSPDAKTIQGELMIEVYRDIISECKLEAISDITMSHFPRDSVSQGILEDGKEYTERENKVKIHFSNREPATKLVGEDEGKLLVASYAWDGNSYPGNEYWLGPHQMNASGDPAAASCSMISELQNPEINPKVSGITAKIFGE